jgi:4-hydroxy-tetrahydrodipicolinate synthase
MSGTFQGVVPAMATPFTRDFRLDDNRVGELIDWYVESGVHGISVAGSQGEFFSLDRDEHLRLLKLSIEATGGRVPVYAGTGAVTTRDSIKLTQAAESLGADLALVITPFFAQPTQDELVEHYVAVAKSTKLPVMLYNNPPRTSVNILPKTLARVMALADNVVGIKDSNGDLTQSVEYLLQTERRGLLFSGRDTIFLSYLFHGAHGSISPAANVFPRLMVKLYDEFRKGNLKEALRISDVFAPLRAAWVLGSFPVVIKEAMALVGKSAGPARPPIQPLSNGSREELKKVIDRIASADAHVNRAPAAAALGQ